MFQLANERIKWSENKRYR